MNGRNEENLKELFEKFYDSEQAKKFVEDVHQAEQILREHPAPQPDDALIVDIKSQIATSLSHRQANAFRKAVCKVAFVAATVIIFAAIGVKIFEKGGGEPQKLYASVIPAAIWESDDIASDDFALATLITEIEQIEAELLVIQLGVNGGNGQRTIVEVEIEFIDEIDSDFWKG